MTADAAMGPDRDALGVDLFWIPLGAGGVGFVRFNGRVYERLAARREGRPPLQLYHTALEVRTSEGRFIVETAWPSPDADLTSRGGVTERPVFSRRLFRLRHFRYEVRCWRDGVIPDIGFAVGGPQHLTHDETQAERLLAQVVSVPALVWGRDEHGAGDMWNSNSVISWLLARTGLLADSVRPPLDGRAPGWQSGIVIAG